MYSYCHSLSFPMHFLFFKNSQIILLVGRCRVLLDERWCSKKPDQRTSDVSWEIDRRRAARTRSISSISASPATPASFSSNEQSRVGLFGLFGDANAARSILFITLKRRTWACVSDRRFCVSATNASELAYSFSTIRALMATKARGCFHLNHAFFVKNNLSTFCKTLSDSENQAVL